jgi:hypothetical protein
MNSNFDAIEAGFADTVSESAGGTMEVDLDMNSNQLINLGTPTGPSNAATKQYVDSLVTDLEVTIDFSSQNITSGTAVTKTASEWIDNIESMTTRSKIVYAADYVDIASVADQSTQMQAALDAASGGKLMLPAATIYCKALSLPQDTAIEGVEHDKSILKLPNNANTFVLASSHYITNTSWAAYGSEFSNFRIDGNRTNQTVDCDAFVLKTYQSRLTNVQVWSARRYGLLLTAANSDGTLGASGNMANNIFDKCTFLDCGSEGLYIKDHSSKMSDWEVKNCNIWGNGKINGTWNIRSERSAGAQFIANQIYSADGLGNLYLQLCAGTRVIGNHIDITSEGSTATAGTLIGLKMEFATAGWGSSPIVGNDIFCARTALNGTEVIKLAEFSSAVAGLEIAVTGNNFRHVQNLSGVLTWTSTGTLVTHDVGNTYIGYATQPAMSANVKRGLESNAAGTWTLDRAVQISAALNVTGNLSQSASGATTLSRYMVADAAITDSIAKYSNDASCAAHGMQKARGTAAVPANAVQYDEVGRHIWLAQASGSMREAARDTVFIRTASPSSTDMAAGRYFFLCPDGSTTITEVMGLIYSVGLNMYGTTIVDAQKRIHNISFTSTQLNDTLSTHLKKLPALKFGILPLTNPSGQLALLIHPLGLMVRAP